MTNTDHCTETEPPKVVGSPVIVQAHLCRFIVCPCAEGKCKDVRNIFGILWFIFHAFMMEATGHVMS